MTCPSCSKALPGDARFCSHCGARLATPTTTTAPLGDRRVVTVLFADVSGFTSLSERLDPEAVTDLVNRFFQVLTVPVTRYGGTVDKYIGDAVMALFGAPIAHEDDPTRAVMAAFEMQRDAKAFAAPLEGELGLALKVRIGINTGLVVAGAVGGEQKRDYTVMGDAVNLAQRLESAAEPGTVLVSARTFRQSSQDFRYEALPPITVKGKQEPVEVYRLIEPQTRDLRAMHDRIPLVGRQCELDLALSRLKQAFAGRPQVLAIAGAAGMGKSRLAREVLGAFRALEPTGGRAWWLDGRCLSYAQQEAYGPIRRMLLQGLGLDPLQPDTVRAKLEALATELALSDPPLLAAAIGHLLDLEFPCPALDALDPRRRRVRAFEALDALLLAMAHDRALLVIVEDLQWADSASIAWLSSFQAALSTASCRCLLLVLLRPEMAFEAETLLLRPLDETECLTLSAQVLATPASTWSEAERELVGKVMARAEGHPLFLIEALSAARDRAEPMAIPTTLNAVVAARLDALPPAHKVLLQAAAVLGKRFSTEILGSLVQPEPGALDGLVSRGLLHPEGEGAYAFDQILVQEVAYDGLLLATRRELHSLAARALDGAMGPALHPHDIARHYLLAEIPGKAASYLFRAGETSQRSYANREAIAYFHQALHQLEAVEDDVEAPTRSLVLLALAEVEDTIGAYDEAERHLEEALLLLAPDRPVDRSEILRRLGTLRAERRGDYAGALERYEEGLHLLAGQRATGTHAGILLDLARISFRQGLYDRCTTYCQQAIELLSGATSAREEALAHSLTSLCLFRQHRYAEAIIAQQRALELRTAIQDTAGMAASLNSLGNVYKETGEWETARYCYGEALDACERTGDLGMAALMRFNLGDLAQKLGELPRALALAREVHAAFERLESPHHVGMAKILIGSTLLDLGRPHEAVLQLQDGLAIFEAQGFAEHLAEACQLLAQALLAAGDRSAGLDCLFRAEELARREDDRLQQAICRRIRAELALDEGERAGALAQVADALGLLDDLGNAFELARTRVMQSRCLEATGQAEAATTALAAARNVFERLGARGELARLGQDLTLPTEIVSVQGPPYGEGTGVMYPKMEGAGCRVILASQAPWR